MANKFAQFRPHLLDLTPPDNQVEDSRAHNPNRSGKLAGIHQGICLNTLTIRIIGPKQRDSETLEGSTDAGDQAHAQRKVQNARSTNAPYRRKLAPRQRSHAIRSVNTSSPGQKVGAIRSRDVHEHPPLTRTKIAGAFVGMLAIFACLGYAINKPVEPQSISDLRTSGVLQASVAPPEFFFDDDKDALDQLDTNSRTGLSPLPAITDEHFALNSQPLDNLGAGRIFRSPGNSSSQNSSARFSAAEPAESSVASRVEPVLTDESEDQNTHRVAFDLKDSQEPAMRDNVLRTKTPDQLTTSDAVSPSQNSTKSVTGGSLIDSTITVEGGDTLSGILNRHGVSIEVMPQLLNNPIVKDYLSQLEIGQQFRLTRTDTGQFHSLSARIGGEKRITVMQINHGLSIEAIDLPVKRKLVTASGVIDQSLYHAAEQANIKQSTIMELADIFQWELDFAKDIRQGDQFSLVYNKLFREGEYVRDGEILAARFIRGGKAHTAIRFIDDEGKAEYFTPDGQSTQRTFLRHPVDVVRITSKFDPNRLHPVLHQIRAHRGVDYGAPYGSPIYATADGVVDYSGDKNAYGNTVILKHGGKFSTLYAHMSKISNKASPGSQVKQGDVIGYVGKSGRVTGVHLHYEFRVDGVQIDPLAVELPAADPIDEKYLDELKELGEKMQYLMERADKPIVAENKLENSIGGNLVAKNNRPVANQVMASPAVGQPQKEFK